MDKGVEYQKFIHALTDSDGRNSFYFCQIFIVVYDIIHRKITLTRLICFILNINIVCSVFEKSEIKKKLGFFQHN